MVENVPRLLDDYRFAEVRKQLRKLGYEGEPQTCNAADFGVPQRRRRMILIASRVGPIEYAAPIRLSCRRTVRDAIGGLPKPGMAGDALHDFRETRSEKVAELIAAIPKNGGSRLQLGEDWQWKCHQNCDGFKDIDRRIGWGEPAPAIAGGVGICFSSSPNPRLRGAQRPKAARRTNG